MRHALLIGKFYPPHAGHHASIRLAAQECERVTVVVMASFAETIPLADRVAWLRAEHAADRNVRVTGVPCDAPLDVGDETVWSAQVAVPSAALRQLGSERVDVVYTGEDYGDELAARLGAKHRRVPRAANLSGARVRQDPAGCWDELAEPTRAGLATRVVVVGAESTGTTTVARALAESYAARGGVWRRTAWVPEYGREYTEIKWQQEIQRAARPAELDELVWTAVDFDHVAAEQTRRENTAARVGSPLLICDTDAFATAIWERRYLGAAARTAQPWSEPPALPRHDLYLVTDHEDVPWADDGLREGDLETRAAMTSWFVDALTAAGHSWVLLTGTLDARVALAIRTIDPLLARRLTFGEPLHGPGFEQASQ